MVFEIIDHIRKKTWIIDGPDEATVEKKVRDTFPVISRLANTGDFGMPVVVIGRQHWFTMVSDA